MDSGSVSRRSLRRATGVGFLLVGLATAPLPVVSRQENDNLPPLYLTIIVHTEEDTSHGTIPKTHIPDYDGDNALMHHFGSTMSTFADMARRHGAKINFGSDWTFSRGVALHEPTFYTHLEAMGHEIDAHAHESSLLYHEVREEIVRAGGHPTAVASGVDEQGIQEQMEYFDARYPEFRILWGVSLPGHTAGECIAAWVWRPSRADWTQHDPHGPYIYIGHGELLNSLQAIEQAIENRHPDRINAYAVFVSPREFRAATGTSGIDEQWTSPVNSVHFWKNRIQWWDSFLGAIDAFVQAGQVRYATLTEIAEIFIEQEAQLDFDFGEIPRSDASMRVRNIKAGYPLE